MTALRSLPREPRSLALATGSALVLVTLLASLVVGPVAFILPLAVVVALTLVQHPAAALGVFVGVVVLAEAEDPLFGTFYAGLLGPLSVTDGLFLLVLAGTALQLLRERRPVRLPALLALPLALLVLAIAGGAVAGYFGGAGATDLFFAARQLPYLVLLPVVAVNLFDTRRSVYVCLGVAAGLGIAKAVIGLLSVAAGRGTTVEGSTITYYEPAANFLMMVLLLGVLAALLLRARLPLWVLLGSPVMLLSLALSFRRSFWIGIVLGAVLVVVLGSSPLGRRLLLPTAALVGVALWLLSSTGFQSQGPLAQRVESLKPSKIEANAEDRYRFDERANVLAELRAHPVTGLGLAVPWSSAARALPVEHEDGRNYVHSVVLWYWLKLGLLGLLAYLSIMAAAGVLAYRVWREDREPLLRAFGLASLCSLIALAAVETTASFTGVDQRFTIVLAMMMGLLAALCRPEPPGEPAPEPEPEPAV